MRLSAKASLAAAPGFLMVYESTRQEIVKHLEAVGHVYLLVVAAPSGARKRIQHETELTLVPCHELDATDNIFSKDCPHFSQHAKEILLHYNRIADNKNPQGYGDCGLLLVFQHRCPNDSIPVLHMTHSKWAGLFPRHD